MKAIFHGVCRPCGQDIAPGDDVVRRSKGDVVHTACAGGQDDDQ